MTENEWLNGFELGLEILNGKYLLPNETLDEMLNRVSGGDAELKDLLERRKFIFGGRILSNRGLQKLGYKVTYSNCYVVTPPEDNLESIFDCAKRLARTYSYGGGCGVDISKLSPRGAKINNAARNTSGSVSFMDLYSLTTGLIGQNGRRGALMISLDCNHPDIEEFIEIKSDLDKVQKANISIKITDDFLDAVKNNKEYELKYVRKETGEVVSKKVNAKKIFQKLAEQNWATAEPGVLNWSRICNWNLLSNNPDFEYAGTNP